MEMWDIYNAQKQLTGKTAPRGTPLGEGEYRLAVQVWIRNRQGKWLISRRSPNKTQPLMWEPTGGCVQAGENSLQGALREAEEEVGVILDPEKGTHLYCFRTDRPQTNTPGFLDVWLFENDTPREQIVLQPEETCDAKWATAQEILDMIRDGSFSPMKRRPYYKALFQKYDGIEFDEEFRE